MSTADIRETSSILSCARMHPSLQSCQLRMRHMDSKPGSSQVCAPMLFCLAVWLKPLHNGEPGPCAAGDYPVRDGHPLVYASLLNHGNYFLEQPTRKPGHTEERGRPVRQQWFVTHQVMPTRSAPLLPSRLTTSCTTTSKSAQHHLHNV